jgi:hypothetical protein
LRFCAYCGDELRQPPTGRPRRFCGSVCKQRDYRARVRRRKEREALARPAPVVRLARPLAAAERDLIRTARDRACRLALGELAA